MKFAAIAVGAALTVCALVGSAEAKVRKFDHPTHTGTVVSAAPDKLVMTGRNGKEHTHAVAKNATVTINGKPGTMAGLIKGMHVSVTTDTHGTATAVSTVAAPVKPAATTTPTTKAASATTTPAAVTPATVAPAKSSSK